VLEKHGGGLLSKQDLQGSGVFVKRSMITGKRMTKRITLILDPCQCEKLFTP
jgi:hypothetical protein